MPIDLFIYMDEISSYPKGYSTLPQSYTELFETFWRHTQNRRKNTCLHQLEWQATETASRQGTLKLWCHPSLSRKNNQQVFFLLPPIFFDLEIKREKKGLYGDFMTKGYFFFQLHQHVVFFFLFVQGQPASIKRLYKKFLILYKN